MSLPFLNTARRCLVRVSAALAAAFFAAALPLPAAPAAEGAGKVVIHTPYSPGWGAGFAISFPEPMVAAGEVGKPVAADRLPTVTPALGLEGVWDSVSSIALRPKGKFARRCIYEFSIPAGWKSLAGTELPACSVAYCEDAWWRVTDAGSDDGYEPGSPTLFSASDAADDEAVAAAVGKAYYAITEGGSGGKELARIPAQVRPATVADALAHWDAYCWMAGPQQPAKERRAYAALPPETPLPHVWLAEGCALDSPEECATLKLPGLGRFDEEKRCFEDAEVDEKGLCQRFCLSLGAQRLGVGRYRVELESCHPMDEAAPAAAFAATKWYISRLGGERIAPEAGRLVMKDGALVPSAALVKRHPSLAGVRFTPDYEATAASLLRRPQRSGGEIAGLRKLVMQAEVGENRLSLRCVPSLASAYGTEPTDDWAGTDEDEWLESTLAPARPQLACSVMDAGLREGGKRQILYRTLHVDGVTARVYRAAAQGAEPAQLLRAYGEQYMPKRMREADWEEEQELRKQEPTLFKPEGLPVERAEKQLPADGERASLDPSAFFPGKPAHGMYIVELEGKPAAPEWGSRKVVAQGLVQVTDLGLMWKSSAGEFFAYAYRLSDASAVGQGTLHLLDREGAELATLPLDAQGIARGTLPQGAAYAQLRSGDDAYTTALHDAGDRFYNESSGSYYLRQLGINAYEFPEAVTYVFADRHAYRPGETMHVKGYVRFIAGNEVATPGLEGVTLSLEAGGVNRELPATLLADGSFTADILLTGCREDSYARVEPTLRFKGDAAGEAPDQKVLRAKGVDLECESARNLLRQNRRNCMLAVIVADFQRNEFEVEGELRAKGTVLHMDAKATAFTGLPVAGGKVDWIVQRTPLAVHPAAFPEFCFGDFRRGLSDFYESDERQRSASHVQTLRGELDGEGCGSLDFELPPAGFPGRSRVSVSASVTNGNAQTLRCTRQVAVEGSAVYAGLRSATRHSGQGKGIDLEAVLVNADESAYAGAPLDCSVEVTLRRFRSYRYGAAVASGVRSAPEEEKVFSGSLAVGGTPAALALATPEAGIYDIVLAGKDAEGKPFSAAIRHYVWGGADAPWEFGGMRRSWMELVADKECYQPGETAQLLLQTPVNGEVLVTLERGGVRRVLHRAVTVEKPVIDIPIEEGDGPMAYVSCFLVQAPDKRDASGLPLALHGTLALKVDVPEKHLKVELDLPDETPLVRREWTIGGRVLDAAGAPVAGAGVAFYAVDEGTLQVAGYELPDAYARFYGNRACGVSSFCTDGQFVGDDFDRADFGNKGVFIGGGDCAEAEAANESMPRVRENFTPCAFWVGRAETDAEGRFSATYAHPDTMTRYRLMAVADAGDRFGAAEAAYSVVQPVMLEATAPSTVTKGDTLVLPVTVSMLPDALPEGKRGSAEWTLTLQASEAAVFPGDKAEGANERAASQTITLAGGEPKTVNFTVPFISNADEVTLTWSVTSPDPELKGMGDAVALKVKAVERSPLLRTRYAVTVEPDKDHWVRTSSWYKGRFRGGRQDVTVSTSPLVGAAAGFDFLFDYPYGCLEQTASTLLPWLFREELEQGIDLRFPEGADAAARVREGRASLLARLRPDGRFAYWDKDGAASEFSPYALLVLGYLPNNVRERYNADFYALARARSAMETEAAKSPESSLIGLLSQVLHGGYVSTDVSAAIALHDKRSAAESWLAAAIARLAELPEADALRQRAQREEKLKGLPAGALCPPLDTAKMLEMIVRAPKAADTGTALRAYIAEGVEQGRFRSTWEAGWLAILVHEYLSRQEEGGKKPGARVSGTTIEPGKPMRFTRNTALTAGEYLYVNEGSCPLYAAGEVRGYAAEEQAEAVVDKGFRVERRYEKLLPDGTWQPCADFELGDTVRVSLRAQAGAEEKGRYFVLEDRVPAIFEVVNPDLPSQALPAGLAAQRESAWNCPAWVDHREYGRDSVRFFATTWAAGGAALEVSYIARVVRRGWVYAPGAKAEFMYRPEVYGLSIPQRLTVPKK